MTDVSAELKYIAAIAETIREAGAAGVPNGPLYARLMNDLSLAQYQAIIALLKRAKLVKENHHLLTWAGPTF